MTPSQRPNGLRQRLRRQLDRLVESALLLLMLLICTAVVWQVASRYVLGSPSGVTEEASRFLLVWLGLLGASYAARHNAHVRIDLLRSLAGTRAAAVTRGATTFALVLFAGGVLGVGGTALVALSFELDQRSAALGLPLGWVYLILPICGALLGLYAIVGSDDDEAPANSSATTHPAADEERP